ncbi:thiamine pyrophosphate-binding protein [Acidocella sp. MX-AZ02]|uniref:thiamine pyrophosphate-binding protein n=2 Tax=unclassified Acidocella TaxID=2648610 RepID=UPI00028C743F|nr:thiamine pyrophosphate-binding protein [Acidocella sp. MX-AZ02]EKM99440.1 acetolactate synthase [Acidocella sp. MX-AZ02]
MTNTLRGADYIAEFLVGRGVKSVFLVPGGGNMFLSDAMGQAAGLEAVPMHHEQACAMAAEAYSRVTEQVGVALVTSGPGATNAITGAGEAWAESCPLLIISGQVKRADLKGDSGLRQKGPQEVDIVEMVKGMTKYAVTVMDGQDLRYHLEKALHLATTGRPGPVWLDVPLDIQGGPVEPAAMRGFTPPAPAPAAPLRAAAARMIELINAAERPIFFIGHGVRLGGAATLLSEMIEAFGIPVQTSWNAQDMLPADHPLNFGKPGTVALRAPNFAIQNADLLICIGTRLDNSLTAFNPGRFGRAARKVMVDVDPVELHKYTHEIELKVLADAKDFIAAALAEKAGLQPRDRSAWFARYGEWKRRYALNGGAPWPASGEISHFHLISAFAKAFPENALVMTGGSGLAIESFWMTFEAKRGQRLCTTSGLGSMGYGLPAMIGACVARGRVPTIGVESDGSLMMNLQELATLRGLNLPVRMFIINNRGYASIRNTQRNYFNGRYVGTGPEAGLFMPDFVALARAMGLPAMRIEDAADLESGIAHALAQPGPFICDISVTPDESLWPKAIAVPQADGTLLSMPLEDMTPLLPREELRAQMLVGLTEESEKIVL